MVYHFRDQFSGRHYLVGLVSYGIGSRGTVSCGTRKGAVYVNVLHYLRWINKVKISKYTVEVGNYNMSMSQVRVDDLVEDYTASKTLPYDKVDSPVFKAMFDELAELRSREKG